MSFDLLFFRPSGDPPFPLDDLAAALRALPGVELDGRDGDAYRPGRWLHAASGAIATLDLGDPPLEQDDLHPPRAYDGWTPVPLIWHLPLAGPHWQAVETFTAIETLLTTLPGLRALDPEDIHEEEGGAMGPFAWSRPRLIASWELQRRDRCERLAVPAMARGDSLRLWRYRRERAAAAAVRPDLIWPEALVLHDRIAKTARSACLRPATDAWALPPVELVVEPGAHGARVLDAAAFAGAVELPALARLAMPPTAPVPAAGQERFLALEDGDWRD